jgi:pterin-4a-carbinolamine dehydratase
MTSNLDAIATLTVSRDGLRPEDLSHELALLGAHWSIEANELCLALAGPMAKTGAVAAAAGVLADELDHHPKIVVEYGKLRLAISTHDAQAITVMDLVYAARLEQWLRANGW